MDLRLLSALLVGKVISKILIKKGSGATAAPGLYALKIDPNLIAKLTKRNHLESIVVSGTNGKTTTSRLISEILKTKFKVIHNRQGSNLVRGIASTLIEKTSLLGNIDANYALWEADEAALLPISKQIKIDTLVLLNLFRDQLDRYGEIDTTRKKWIEVIKSLSTETTLILNSDDPSTNYLAKFKKGKTEFFGIQEKNINLPTVENIADVKYCINCGAKLTYTNLYSAHLGHYSCSKCDFKRNKPKTFASNIIFKNFDSSYKLTSKQGSMDLKSTLPGLFNIYNISAASAVGNLYLVSAKQIKAKIETFRPAFGRFEQIKIEKTNATIFLIKNPAGTNEVLRLLALQDNINLLIVLNDHIADGADVSWIWDTNWEILKGKLANIFVSGTRASDMALRLKYADIKILKFQIDKDIEKSTGNATTKSKNLVILPTYSSLIQLKETLEKKGINKWQTQ